MKIRKIFGMLAFVAATFMAASCDGINDNELPKVNVNGIEITSASLQDGQLVLTLGATETLTVNITPADATVQDLVALSTNEDVARVVANATETGITYEVQAVGAGSAIITITSVDNPGINQSFEVNVADEVIPANESEVSQGWAQSRQK